MKYQVIYEGDAEQMFDDYLDEVSEPYKMFGMTFYPSKILSECDPIAYDLGLSEFIDNLVESDIYVYGLTDDQKPTDEEEEDEE